MTIEHIAIIMDGNGRWALSHGFKREEGYKAGLSALRKIIKFLKTKNIKTLTVFAFSTENEKRPENEKNAIFEAITDFLKAPESDTAIRFFGNFSHLPENLKNFVDKTNASFQNDAKICLNIALNYGSKADILNAVNDLLKLGKKEILEEDLASALSTKDFPPLDAIIRTGGEMRLSNFLLYEAAYAELYFSDKLWPDFEEKDMEEAIVNLEQRKRKFGGLLNL